MNNTHGDILHTPITVNELTANDLVYCHKTEDTTGGVSSNKPYGEYNPPRGEVGWICPICGRGLAPSTSYCPCNLTRNITYSNGGTTIKDSLYRSIDCNSTPPEIHCAATVTTATNKCNCDAYGAHCGTHD